MDKAGVRTLAALGELMGRDILAKEERLLAFLTAYALANKGETPSFSCMANHLDVLEEGVRILLAKLENKGKIHFISRNPPRIMVIGQDKLPHEPSAADMGLAKEGAEGRYLNAEGERMRLGRFIASHEKLHGKGPSLGQMVEFVGWANHGYVNRMAEILAERGLLQYGRGVPTRLTDIGATFFGVKRQPQPMEQQKMETEHPKTDAMGRTIVMRGRKAPAERVDALCKALAAAIRDDPATGNYRKYDDFGRDLGYGGKGNKGASGAITDIVHAAVDAGYIKPKPKKTRGLFFTQKGALKYLPEMVTTSEYKPQPSTPTTVVYGLDEPQRQFDTCRAEARPMSRPTVNDAGTLDFNLTSGGISLNGTTKSAAALRAFAAKLEALAALLEG